VVSSASHRFGASDADNRIGLGFEAFEGHRLLTPAALAVSAVGDGFEGMLHAPESLLLARFQAKRHLLRLNGVHAPSS
jgi:hypothetical protein